ncbi:MAG: TfpX/TfpZ family type IV pilin accessory protein [Pseudomonadota bacterium]
MKKRLSASLLHLMISFFIGAGAAALVFFVWYPGQFRDFSGGTDLFLLIVSVDIVSGPVLTFAVFNLKKPQKELFYDLTFVAIFQFCTLFYGLHIVFEARPVAMVFEVDRFRVISANEVLKAELPLAPDAYKKLPLTGPWLLGASMPTVGADQLDAIQSALEKGFDIAQRPKFWRPYESFTEEALARSKPVNRLLEKNPRWRSQILEALASKGFVNAESVSFLPLVARGEWLAFLDQNGRPFLFIEFDGAM